MTGSKFDAIVKARANERVQARIQQFRKDVREAVKKLSPALLSDYAKPLHVGAEEKVFKGGDLDNNRTVVAYLTGRADVLPAVLWRKEEEAVSKELLATMDEMQKALIAPASRPDDVLPTPLP